MKKTETVKLNKSQPHTISVTGGKGGTGKSTFAIILALKLIAEGKKVLLIDCDVECPNDHLLLGLDELQNPIQQTFTYYPEFLQSECLKCGKCVENCKAGALFQPSGQIPMLEPDLCTACGVCWNICPYDAIKKKKKKNGEIFVNKINSDLTLVTGRSIPGTRETSPVVEQTRSFSKHVNDDFDVVIIDTAAGSHCTVMRALEDTAMAIAVTEPTPMGAHDLKVILRVLDVLEVPAKVVINRSDIGDQQSINQVVSELESSIFGYIPYDKKLAEIYASGNFNDNKKYLLSLFQTKK